MYRVFLTPEAREELNREIAYSEEKWGKAHARRYAHEIRRRIRVIGKNPKVYSISSDIFPGIRIARYKGNQIIYTVVEEDQTVIILGVPSIYRELAPRSVPISRPRGRTTKHN